MKTLDQMSPEELRTSEPSKVDFVAISEMAGKIAKTFHPDRIILFGSYVDDFHFPPLERGAWPPQPGRRPFLH